MPSQNRPEGTVFWVTGLSGAGKSSVGKAYAEQLRAAGRPVIFMDGDVLREVFANDLGHSLAERLAVAMRNARLCRMLAEQGVDVVCATISMFHEVRAWNRKHISRYREIYIRVPMSVLIERDPKQIYARALRGELEHVMGIDLPVDEPESPDLILDNDGTLPIATLVEQMAQTFSTYR